MTRDDNGPCDTNPYAHPNPRLVEKAERLHARALKTDNPKERERLMDAANQAWIDAHDPY